MSDGADYTGSRMPEPLRRSHSDTMFTMAPDPTSASATATASPGRSRSGLGYRIAVLIAVLLAASAIITTLFSVRAVQSAMYKQTTESVDNIHVAVGELISVEYDNVTAFRQASLDLRKKELESIAAPISTALDALRSEAATGQTTEAEAKATALEMLKTIRYGNKDYFFTYDRNMTAISHPDAKFQGRNLIDLQDADGKYVLREIRDVALNQGHGFVDYRWVRLNEDKPSPKIGYVFHYEPWDWIIGTGVYVDDIDAEAKKRLTAEQVKLSSTFDDVQFSQDGFFFILDQAGNVVVSPQGHDLSSLANTTSGQQYVTDILATAPTTDGPITTLDSDVALQGDQSEVWSTTISAFTPLGWILVSAVPEAVLEAPGRTLAWQQAGLSLIVLLIGLVSGLLLSRRIIRPVEAVTRAARDLSEDRFDPSSLDAAAKRTDEVGELARTFQRMGAEIVARERRLREQVAKLSVQIDRTKVEEAVSDIAESEYFLRIKERAEELRWNRREEPPTDE